MILKKQLFILLRKLCELNAKYQIKQLTHLNQMLIEYSDKTKSTGCSYSDYWELYKAIRTHKPKEVLELGTGVTTIIIACALLENSKEGYLGNVTSLEEIEEYYELSLKLLPQSLQKVVNIMHSNRIEKNYSLFRGCCYKDIPDKPYDFVFIDGPDYVTISDNMVTFDYDFINIVKKSAIPVHGLVDKRVSTCYVLQKIFGKEKIRYDAVKHIGYLGPCNQEDLKEIDNITPSSAFTESFKLLRNSELKLEL